MQSNSPVTAPAGLFDPIRHEALCVQPWSEATARDAIRDIAAEANDAFSPQALWPTHPRDDPQDPDVPRSMLYQGAGGIIWALRHLVQTGWEVDGDLDFSATIASLPARHRATGNFGQALDVNSFLMGDAGLLLLQHGVGDDPDVADALFEAVQSNLHHPALENLWGSPGSLLAAIHMSEATGDPRWAELVERGVRILLDAMTFDAVLGGWAWRQNLYGRTRTFLGAGHGLAGNLFVALRAASLLSPALVREMTDRGLQTLKASALRSQGCLTSSPPSALRAAACAGRKEIPAAMVLLSVLIPTPSLRWVPVLQRLRPLRLRARVV